MLRRHFLPMVIGLLLIIPATASAKTVTANGRGITATLAYSGTAGAYRNLSLTIGQGSRSLYTGAVRAPECGSDCWPQLGTPQRAVTIAPLDGAGSADVLLNLYSGGANCCSVLQVFRPSAALGGEYTLATEHDFSSEGYRLRRIDGEERFVTGDEAFDTTFTDFAASGEPLQLLSLQGIRFADVTREHRYRSLVRGDATRWLYAYTRAHGQDDVGLIAPWAADEATLGRSRQAFAYLDAQARAGRLQSAFGPAESGLRFVAKLRTLLRREGYLH